MTALPAQSAMAELFKHLAGGIQVNGRTDARSDRAVRQQLPDRSQPVRVRSCGMQERTA